ncbi:ABC-F family ATP-binding cassette domain-containing protein [Undibacterium sp. Ren11W]|uniref:ABC-F family ATP-binding cassette domain-containing protein n=1 Tax=Undibacterium sp. Ren11W TaxID=3413045 RepID=UPI003BF31D73
MSIIQLQGVGLDFSHKSCFSDFSASISWGQRIAIVGDNGTGKSSLLQMLHGSMQPSSGCIQRHHELGIGYVEQVHSDHDGLSGGERVNQALNQALSIATDLLLLDEPTNHLDIDNRRTLTRMLQKYYGSIVLVTHDEKLMNQVCDTIWHIGNGTITVFEGRYADFLAQQKIDRETVERQLIALKRAQHEAHNSLMQEQERAAHAKQRGIQSVQNRKWPTIKSPTKLARGNTTSGHKFSEIKQQRHELAAQLEQLPSDTVILPQFHLGCANQSKGNIVQIAEGAIGYQEVLLKNIYITLSWGERLALTGKNGSGKSTLARAIMVDESVRRGGDWFVPHQREIGYLDQHYANLNPQQTVLQALTEVVPDWTELALRHHLSDFLFRQQSATCAKVAMLSGGERARLSLACIAAKPPQLLILDEVTNNMDRRMREHVIEILADYPGTMLLISHDADFLEQIGRVQKYQL